MEKTEIAKSRRLLTVTIIFFWASEYCHAPYFTPYLQTLGFAAGVIGFITGTYGITQAIVRIPLGMLTDATGAYKRTIVAGTLFTTVSSFGLIFATDLVPILICRVLAGFAASTWLAFTVLYNAYYTADESVSAMTNVNAFNSAGKFLAFFLGLISATLWGYRIPLVCSFLTGCVAVVCAFCLKPIPVNHVSFRLNQAIQAATSPAVLCAAAFVIVMQFFQQGTVFSFTSAVGRSLGGSALEIGAATLLFTVVQVFGAKTIKNTLKKVSASSAVCINCLFMTISALLVGFAQNMWFIYIGQIFAGIASLSVNSVMMAMIVRNIPQEKQSTAMGMFQALYGIGMAAGPFMVGAIVNSSGYTVAYGMVAVVTLLAAAAAPIAIKTAERFYRK